MVETLDDIVTHFLTIIALDLANVLSLFRLLVFFFDFDSIEADSESSTIPAIRTRAATITSLSLLVFIGGLIIRRQCTRLSIGRPGFFSIVFFRIGLKSYLFWLAAGLDNNKNPSLQHEKRVVD